MDVSDNIGGDNPDSDHASAPAEERAEQVSRTQLAALRKLSQISNDAPTFDLALKRSLKVVAETLEVEQALLLLHDEPSRSLMPYSFAIGFTTVQAMELGRVYIDSSDPSLALEAFQNNRALISNDCPNDAHCDQQRVREFNIFNQMVVPIQSEQHTLGVCLAFNKASGSFTPIDLELFETLTIPLANLLKNIGLVKNLKDEQRRHLAVLDAAVDGFIEVDRNFRIILFNKGAENLTGWTPEAALGRTCSEVLQPHEADGSLLCHNCPLERSFRTGLSVSNVEQLIHMHEGDDTWASCSYNSVTNEQGEVVSGVIAIKDIYRLKALGDELQQQIQQQQSLLGVINAINGLSNIKEIYREALNAVRKTIQFDVGTIHAIEPDGKTLKLIDQYQATEGEVTAKQIATTPEPTLDLLDTLKEELDGLSTGQMDEYKAFEEMVRSRHLENQYSSYSSTAPTDMTLAESKAASSCEALRQNEPYLAVNLPGTPVCPVLADFPGLQSHICVPIKTQDHTYGVLHLASYHPYAFWGSDFSLVYNICKQIAVAAERASLFEKIDRLARTDPLTELFNKTEFWERMDIELNRAERHNTPLTLMVLDLDRLKWFNDFYGHVYGDVLLNKIAKVVVKKSRASDIAFRFGGDELCLLLPDTTSEEAWLVAERIREAVAGTSVFPDPVVIGAVGMVTMSIGVATYPRDAKTGHELFLCADAAQYRAKNTGKDRVCIYDYAVDYKDLTSHRRNPSDFDMNDPRLALPTPNPADAHKRRPPTPTPSDTADTILGDKYIEEAEFELDPESQYDIEVLPDPTEFNEPPDVSNHDKQ